MRWHSSQCDSFFVHCFAKTFSHNIKSVFPTILYGLNIFLSLVGGENKKNNHTHKFYTIKSARDTTDEKCFMTKLNWMRNGQFVWSVSILLLYSSVFLTVIGLYIFRTLKHLAHCTESFSAHLQSQRKKSTNPFSFNWSKKTWEKKRKKTHKHDELWL